MSILRGFVVILLIKISLESEGDFKEMCLEVHNFFRACHNAQPLEYDNAVQAQAQSWADNLASKNIFAHSQVDGFGENLYGTSNRNPDGKAAVKAWYDEIKDYDFKEPGFSSGTGHFTQVVWKRSKKLGCAWAKSSNYLYVVANYVPPGNLIGDFEGNVERATQDPSSRTRRCLRKIPSA